MFGLEAVGEASMAAGPVGMAGGVLGGRALFVAESNLLTDRVDEVAGGTGFKANCLCEKVLLSIPFPPEDSKLSFLDEPVLETACTADDEFVTDRIARDCVSDFARVSSPWVLGSL